MESVFGDGLGGVLEKIIGFVAECGYDGVDHGFFNGVATLSGGFIFCPVSGVCFFLLREGVFH
jgi:hypothetical protein